MYSIFLENNLKLKKGTTLDVVQKHFEELFTQKIEEFRKF